MKRKGIIAFCKGDPYAVKVYDPYAAISPSVECAGDRATADEIRAFYEKEGIQTQLVVLGRKRRIGRPGARACRFGRTKRGTCRKHPRRK